MREFINNIFQSSFLTSGFDSARFRAETVIRIVDKFKLYLDYMCIRVRMFEI